MWDPLCCALAGEAMTTVDDIAILVTANASLTLWMHLSPSEVTAWIRNVLGASTAKGLLSSPE